MLMKHPMKEFMNIKLSGICDTTNADMLSIWPI